MAHQFAMNDNNQFGASQKQQPTSSTWHQHKYIIHSSGQDSRNARSTSQGDDMFDRNESGEGGNSRRRPSMTTNMAMLKQRRSQVFPPPRRPLLLASSEDPIINNQTPLKMTNRTGARTKNKIQIPFDPVLSSPQQPDDMQNTVQSVNATHKLLVDRNRKGFIAPRSKSPKDRKKTKKTTFQKQLDSLTRLPEFYSRSANFTEANNLLKASKFKSGAKEAQQYAQTSQLIREVRSSQVGQGARNLAKKLNQMHQTSSQVEQPTSQTQLFSRSQSNFSNRHRDFSQKLESLNQKRQNMPQNLNNIEDIKTRSRSPQQKQMILKQRPASAFNRHQSQLNLKKDKKEEIRGKATKVLQRIQSAKIQQREEQNYQNINQKTTTKNEQKKMKPPILNKRKHLQTAKNSRLIQQKELSQKFTKSLKYVNQQIDNYVTAQRQRRVNKPRHIKSAETFKDNQYSGLEMQKERQNSHNLLQNFEGEQIRNPQTTKIGDSSQEHIQKAENNYQSIDKNEDQNPSAIPLQEDIDKIIKKTGFIKQGSLSAAQQQITFQVHNYYGGCNNLNYNGQGQENDPKDERRQTQQQSNTPATAAAARSQDNQDQLANLRPEKVQIPTFDLSNSAVSNETFSPTTAPLLESSSQLLPQVKPIISRQQEVLKNERRREREGRTTGVISRRFVGQQSNLQGPSLEGGRSTSPKHANQRARHDNSTQKFKLTRFGSKKIKKRSQIDNLTSYSGYGQQRPLVTNTSADEATSCLTRTLTPQSTNFYLAGLPPTTNNPNYSKEVSAEDPRNQLNKQQRQLILMEHLENSNVPNVFRTLKMKRLHDQIQHVQESGQTYDKAQYRSVQKELKHMQNSQNLGNFAFKSRVKSAIGLRSTAEIGNEEYHLNKSYLSSEFGINSRSLSRERKQKRHMTYKNDINSLLHPTLHRVQTANQYLKLRQLSQVQDSIKDDLALKYNQMTNQRVKRDCGGLNYILNMPNMQFKDQAKLRKRSFSPQDLVIDFQNHPYARSLRSPQMQKMSLGKRFDKPIESIRVRSKFNVKNRQKQRSKKPRVIKNFKENEIERELSIQKETPQELIQRLRGNRQKVSQFQLNQNFIEQTQGVHNRKSLNRNDLLQQNGTILEEHVNSTSPDHIKEISISETNKVQSELNYLPLDIAVESFHTSNFGPSEQDVARDRLEFLDIKDSPFKIKDTSVEMNLPFQIGNENVQSPKDSNKVQKFELVKKGEYLQQQHQEEVQSEIPSSFKTDSFDTSSEQKLLNNDLMNCHQEKREEKLPTDPPKPQRDSNFGLKHSKTMVPGSQITTKNEQNLDITQSGEGQSNCAGFLVQSEKQKSLLKESQKQQPDLSSQQKTSQKLTMKAISMYQIPAVIYNESVFDNKQKEASKFLVLNKQIQGQNEINLVEESQASIQSSNKDQESKSPDFIQSNPPKKPQKLNLDLVNLQSQNGLFTSQQASSNQKTLKKTTNELFDEEICEDIEDSDLLDEQDNSSKPAAMGKQYQVVTSKEDEIVLESISEESGDLTGKNLKQIVNYSPKFLQNEEEIIFGSQNNSIAFSIKSGPWNSSSAKQLKDDQDQERLLNDKTICLLDHPTQEQLAEQEAIDSLEQKYIEELILESPRESEERRLMNPILTRLEKFEMQEAQNLQSFEMFPKNDKTAIQGGAENQRSNLSCKEQPDIIQGNFQLRGEQISKTEKHLKSQDLSSLSQNSRDSEERDSIDKNDRLQALMNLQSLHSQSNQSPSQPVLNRPNTIKVKTQKSLAPTIYSSGSRKRKQSQVFRKSPEQNVFLSPTKLGQQSSIVINSAVAPEDGSPSIMINLDMLKPVLEMQQSLAVGLIDLKNEVRKNSILQKEAIEDKSENMDQIQLIGNSQDSHNTEQYFWQEISNIVEFKQDTVKDFQDFLRIEVKEIDTSLESKEEQKLSMRVGQDNDSVASGISSFRLNHNFAQKIQLNVRNDYQKPIKIYLPKLNENHIDEENDESSQISMNLAPKILDINQLTERHSDDFSGKFSEELRQGNQQRNNSCSKQEQEYFPKTAVKNSKIKLDGISLKIQDMIHPQNKLKDRVQNLRQHSFCGFTDRKSYKFLENESQQIVEKPVKKSRMSEILKSNVKRLLKQISFERGQSDDFLEQQTQIGPQTLNLRKNIIGSLQFKSLKNNLAQKSADPGLGDQNGSNVQKHDKFIDDSLTDIRQDNLIKHANDILSSNLRKNSLNISDEHEILVSETLPLLQNQIVQAKEVQEIDKKFHELPFWRQKNQKLFFGTFLEMSHILIMDRSFNLQTKQSSSMTVNDARKASTKDFRKKSSTKMIIREDNGKIKMPFMRKGTLRLEPQRRESKKTSDNIVCLTEFDAIKFILNEVLKFNEKSVTDLMNFNYFIDISPKLIQESLKIEVFQDGVESSKKATTKQYHMNKLKDTYFALQQLVSTKFDPKFQKDIQPITDELLLKLNQIWPQSLPEDVEFLNLISTGKFVNCSLFYLKIQEVPLNLDQLSKINFPVNYRALLKNILIDSSYEEYCRHTWMNNIDVREQLERNLSQADQLFQYALNKKHSLLNQINQEFSWFFKLIMRRSSARKELQDSLFANKQRLLVDSLLGIDQQCALENFQLKTKQIVLQNCNASNYYRLDIYSSLNVGAEGAQNYQSDKIFVENGDKMLQFSDMITFINFHPLGEVWIHQEYMESLVNNPNIRKVKSDNISMNSPKSVPSRAIQSQLTGKSIGKSKPPLTPGIVNRSLKKTLQDQMNQFKLPRVVQKSKDLEEYKEKSQATSKFFAFKLNDEFGYLTKIIEKGCYQIICPQRPQFLIEKQLLAKRNLEIKIRQGVDITEKLDSIKSGKKIRNFSSTKFPKILPKESPVRRLESKITNSSKGDDTLQQSVPKLPQNKRSQSQPAPICPREDLGDSRKSLLDQQEADAASFGENAQYDNEQKKKEKTKPLKKLSFKNINQEEITQAKTQPKNSLALFRASTFVGRNRAPDILDLHKIKEETSQQDNSFSSHSISSSGEEKSPESQSTRLLKNRNPIQRNQNSLNFLRAQTQKTNILTEETPTPPDQSSTPLFNKNQIVDTFSSAQKVMEQTQKTEINFLRDKPINFSPDSKKAPSKLASSAVSSLKSRHLVFDKEKEGGGTGGLAIYRDSNNSFSELMKSSAKKSEEVSMSDDLKSLETLSDQKDQLSNFGDTDSSHSQFCLLSDEEAMQDEYSSLNIHKIKSRSADFDDKIDRKASQKPSTLSTNMDSKAVNQLTFNKKEENFEEEKQGNMTVKNVSQMYSEDNFIKRGTEIQKLVQSQPKFISRKKITVVRYIPPESKKDKEKEKKAQFSRQTSLWRKGNLILPQEESLRGKVISTFKLSKNKNLPVTNENSSTSVDTIKKHNPNVSVKMANNTIISAFRARLQQMIEAEKTNATPGGNGTTLMNQSLDKKQADLLLEMDNQNVQQTGKLLQYQMHQDRLGAVDKHGNKRKKSLLVQRSELKREREKSSYVKRMQEIEAMKVFQTIERGQIQGIEEIVHSNTIGIDTEDAYGNSLLMMAVQYGNYDFCKFLLKNGATVDHQNSSGNTALHYAVSLGFPAIIDLLVESGTDETIKNKKRLTVWQGI